MAVQPKVVVNLETYSGAFTKGLEGAGRDVKKFAQTAEKAFKNLTFQGGASGFASAFASATKAAEDFATAIRTGGSAQQELGKLVNQIPIVGQFKQAGEAIRELITGEKAAIIQMDKMAESATKVVANLREAAKQEELLGKYGVELAQLQAKNTKDSTITSLNAKNEELQRKLVELNDKATLTVDSNGNEVKTYTDAQEVERKQLLTEKASNDALKVAAEKTLQQQLVEITKDRDQRIYQEHVSSLAETDALEASMQEKSLRRQGKGLESAVVAVRAEGKAKVDAINAQLKDQRALDKIGDPVERDAHIAELNAKRIAAIKSTSTTIADLTAEDNRRKQALTEEGQEKIRQIRAAGTIAALKATDAALNEGYEREGSSLRSHLAEQAEIQEEYRKQIADIDKKYKENKYQGHDDQEQKKQLEAAAAIERQQKLGQLGASSTIEANKRDIEHARELRKAWEEAGDPLEKYKNKLVDIREAYAKYHDKKLRDTQLQQLDDETLQSLKQTDRGPKIDLYGRTSGTQYITAGGDSLAAQQLAEIKKQADKEEERQKWLYDMWQALKDKANGIVQELNIDAIGY